MFTENGLTHNQELVVLAREKESLEKLKKSREKKSFSLGDLVAELDA